MFGDTKNKQKANKELNENIGRALNEVRIVNCAVICANTTENFNDQFKNLQDAGYTPYKDIIVFEDRESGYMYYHTFVKTEKRDLQVKNPVSYIWDETCERKYINTDDPIKFNVFSDEMEKAGFAPFYPNGVNVRQHKETGKVWFEMGFVKMKTVSGLITTSGNALIH